MPRPAPALPASNPTSHQQRILALFAGPLLVAQGFTSSDVAAMLRRVVSEPGGPLHTSERMAERMERHAAGVEQMRAAERERVAEVHGGTVAPKRDMRIDLAEVIK